MSDKKPVQLLLFKSLSTSLLTAKQGRFLTARRESAWHQTLLYFSVGLDWYLFSSLKIAWQSLFDDVYSSLPFSITFWNSHQHTVKRSKVRLIAWVSQSNTLNMVNKDLVNKDQYWDFRKNKDHFTMPSTGFLKIRTVQKIVGFLEIIEVKSFCSKNDKNVLLLFSNILPAKWFLYIVRYFRFFCHIFGKNKD